MALADARAFVIGGGAIGLCVAESLQARGAEVTVFERGLALLQRAAAIAGASFDRLGQRGVEFELHDDPLLYPAFDARELDHLREIVAALRAAGGTQRLVELKTDETLDIEPALDPGVVGAVIAHGERRVRPELLTAGLHRMLIERGVEVHERSPVSALVPDGSRWMVDDGVGGDRADAIVLAGGIGTTGLLAGLGTRLPVLAAKGYSRTYRRDRADESGGPRGPLYLESPKVAISVFDDSVRVSGMLELGARGLALSGRRLAALSAAAARALPGWTMSQPTDWAGMRSLSPDGLPFIGAFQVVGAYMSRPRTPRWGSHLLH